MAPRRGFALASIMISANPAVPKPEATAFEWLIGLTL
jgi:hypothetical protein